MTDSDKRIISENIKIIKENIFKFSPTPEKVKLLAATKTVDPERIKFAMECGCDLIGENRVNELMSKYDVLRIPREKIHYIGRLQKNKVKYLIDKVALIHSVDNIPLAAEIDRLSQKEGVVTDILVQVNIGYEQTKGGVLPEDIVDFVDEISSFKGVNVKGLMTIPPISGNKAKLSSFFEKMRKILVDIQLKNVDNDSIDILSMGMSSDYCEALEYGANIIRLGSAIFGERS